MVRRRNGGTRCVLTKVTYMLTKNSATIPLLMITVYMLICDSVVKKKNARACLFFFYFFTQTASIRTASEENFLIV